MEFANFGRKKVKSDGWWEWIEGRGWERAHKILQSRQDTKRSFSIRLGFFISKENTGSYQ